MKIDRSNYETWLIDWLDGNLSEPEIMELNQFLSNNPDLLVESEELSSFSLQKPSLKYHGKDNLRRSPSDLSDLQFEYLCVASMEKDLTTHQQTEFQEIIESDPVKRKTFGLINKTQLLPSKISYRNKKYIIKKTLLRKITEFSAIGLSAAAAVIFAIITIFGMPESQSDNRINKAQSLAAENITHQEKANIPEETFIADTRPAGLKKNLEASVAVISETTGSDTQSDAGELKTDSQIPKLSLEQPEIKMILVNSAISISEGIPSSDLIASEFEVFIPEDNDERSFVAKFLARTFHEKILKEEVSDDAPVKGYEIAEAGVTGLNKLLGWEMEMEKNSGKNGEINSIYFSSRLIKLNVPVKKTEPLQ